MAVSGRKAIHDAPLAAISIMSSTMGKEQKSPDDMDALHPHGCVTSGERCLILGDLSIAVQATRTIGYESEDTTF